MPKDPLEYWKKLLFHQQVQSVAEYGIVSFNSQEFQLFVAALYCLSWWRRGSGGGFLNGDRGFHRFILQVGGIVSRLHSTNQGPPREGP
ncbi:hypothetical protein EBZ80_25645 [bacterium]|nr:hypothetical protein [bacterium]